MRKRFERFVRMHWGQSAITCRGMCTRLWNIAIQIAKQFCVISYEIIQQPQQVFETGALRKACCNLQIVGKFVERGLAYRKLRCSHNAIFYRERRDG